MENLRSPERPRRSRVMAVMEVVLGSQVMPGHESGQEFQSGNEEEFQAETILSSGSDCIPFLNSSKDRSSDSEAEVNRKSRERK